MRFARFQNWLRSLFGLPRKPINYNLRCKGGYFGLAGKPIGAKR